MSPASATQRRDARHGVTRRSTGVPVWLGLARDTSVRPLAARLVAMRAPLFAIAVLVTSHALEVEALACSKDEDCPGKDICEAGSCRAPRAPGRSSESPTTTSPELVPETDAIESGAVKPSGESRPRNDGPTCTRDAECGTDLCVDGRCADTPVTDPPSVMLGAGAMTTFGVSGLVRDPVPGMAIGLDLATTGFVRYRLAAAYQNLNGYHGFVLAPLDFGISLPITRGATSVVLEPILEPFKLTVLSRGEQLAFTVASGVDLAAVVSFKETYVMVAPIGVEARYLTLVGRLGEGSVPDEFGLNWRVRLAAGWRL